MKRSLVLRSSSLLRRAPSSLLIRWKPKRPTRIVLFHTINRGAAHLTAERISGSTTLASIIKTCATVIAAGHSTSGANRDRSAGLKAISNGAPCAPKPS